MDSKLNAGQKTEPHFVICFDDSGRNGKSFDIDLLTKMLHPIVHTQGPDFSAKEEA